MSILGPLIDKIDKDIEEAAAEKPASKVTDFELAYERLTSALTVLSVEVPPWDPPLSAGEGRLDHYGRGRQETWAHFEAAILKVIEDTRK